MTEAEAAELVQCEVERELLLHLPEHELVLSFDNDSGCVLFHEWWRQVGQSAFTQWVSARPEEEE